MTDDLTIPDFLRRTLTTPAGSTTNHRRRERKIPYPRDGYACKGKREAFRIRHRAALRRRADKMRQR